MSAGCVAASFLAAAPSQASRASHAAATPRWILHIERYPGGISDGVRAMVSAEAVAARAAARKASITGASAPFGPNVQMNKDSNPPLPQNETAVAVSLADPKIAVAAANDYVSGGNIVMRTTDGGRHWASTRVIPFFGGTGDTCSGGDPSVAYSRRDHVFYMGQLCFFRSLPFSEVQVYVSRNNGRTWTPGLQAARAATNFNYKTGKVNTSIFNDKDYIAVDNTPTSPHYGRLYVGYTKFHMLANGFSDYCPLQLSYTDTFNITNPVLTTFHHTAIQPDNPGGNGLGRSANQYFTPQVEPDGALDVAFMQEACNTSGYEVTKDVVFHLADGVNPDVITTAEAAAGSVPGVIHAHARARWTGRTLRVEIEGWVDPELPAKDADATGRRVADEISRQLPEAGSLTWAARAAPA